MTGRRGRWIAFEGLDGCGKSTQVTRLAERLGGRTVREPGGTPLGGALRELLLHSDGAVDPRCEVMLFAADRAQLVTTVVEPALAAGIDVVSDRSLWSSVAYQGGGRGLGVDAVEQLNRWALGGLLPDIVVLLDVDGSVADQRLGDARDRIERAPLAFFEQTAAHFRNLASVHDWIVVDGSASLEAVNAAVDAAVDARLAR